MKRIKDLVIVGNGMATCRLLDELMTRNALERYRISVIGEEAQGAYNRILLSKVLAGADPDSVITKPPSWYAERGIELIRGVSVERIDSVERRVVIHGREGLRYDLAVLATGSQPIVPPMEGMSDADGELKPGAFVYRTLEDCQRIRAYARAGDSAVVLGGGLLGLEAAKALGDLGMHVTCVHLAHQLMNAQVDFVGGEMLRRQIERSGLFVRTGRTIERILGDERVEGVVLDDGQQLAADIAVIACGVRPRTEVARNSKIPVNRGIVVNDTLATQVPGVYAIGDCIEHAGVSYGLVAPAWEQAGVLADVLTGTRPEARYRGSKLYTRLKVAGVEVASMGEIEPKLETDRVIQVIEERHHSYRKLVVRDRQLVGAVFVGDVRQAPALIQTFDRGDPLPEDPLEALCAFSAGSAACARGDRTVCNCHRVTEDAIAQVVAAGASTLEAVAEQTRASTGCGSCRSEVVRLVSLHAKPPALAKSA